MQQVIVFFAISISLAFAGILPCGTNEEFTHCGTLCPKTCYNYNKSQPQMCPEVCVVGCSCKEGFIRKSVDGPCVAVEECASVPQCDENEEFRLCSSACPSTCDDDDVVPKKCPLKCVHGCACKDGFVRNTKGGKCVRKDTCVKKTDEQVCKENEVYKECGTLCPGTCSEPIRNCPKSCSKGCFCEDGYLLDDNTNECVKIEDCPNKLPF